MQKTRFDPWVRKIPWRMEWLPTPVFFPGKFHGQRTLVGSRGLKEFDTTEGSKSVKHNWVTNAFLLNILSAKVTGCHFWYQVIKRLRLTFWVLLHLHTLCLRKVGCHVASCLLEKCIRQGTRKGLRLTSWQGTKLLTPNSTEIESCQKPCMWR